MYMCISYVAVSDGKNLVVFVWFYMFVWFRNSWFCRQSQNAYYKVYHIYYKCATNLFSFVVPSCYVTPTCSGEPLNVSLTFSECCLSSAGVSYDLDGRCQPCLPTSKYSFIIFISEHN